jgi:putative transposase
VLGLVKRLILWYACAGYTTPTKGLLMPCPHCQFIVTQERAARTQLGYRTFRCGSCKRTFNERSGTPFNHLTFPSDIVLQVVLWRLRYKLSLRDLAEMFLERGFTFTHEAVRAWETRFAPLLAKQLRTRRHGQAGRSWYVDETYVKVSGQWCYLYRAIDREGNLVDSMLSKTRDMVAAQHFFRQAHVVAGRAPERVTTDGHQSYPRAIREVLGEEVKHRSKQYLNGCVRTQHANFFSRLCELRSVRKAVYLGSQHHSQQGCSPLQKLLPSLCQ